MNVPKLRFKEFDGEWEVNLLKDITEINPKSEALDEKFEYIDLEAVSKGLLINSKVIDKFQAPSRAQRVVSKNDILYQTVRPYQKNNLFINFENKNLQMVASTGYAQIRTHNKIDAKWLYQAINTSKFTHNVLLKCTGTSYPAINSSDLGEIEIKFPELKEQKKIGLFFEIIDKKIQLQQQKIDLLQEQKKGFLQKMFPKAGETQPEIRFKGYKDNWKQKKLEEVTSRVKGNDGRMDLPTLTISASQGWLDQRERFSANIAGKEQKNYTLLKKGQLSYNHGNSKLAKYGVVFELDAYEEALVPRVYHSFETNNFADSKFIQYMFETKRTDKELAKLISSGARMDGLLNINYDEFMGITVSIPDIKEQKKIAEFFTMLNEKINTEKEKLRELEKQKQGFMQQMFI